MEAAVWGFVGTLVGALVSLLTTRFNNEHSAELKRVEREALREQEARAFQRETLLKLQDEINRFYRLFAESASGPEPKLNLEYASAGMEVNKLVQRLNDAPVRAQVLAFMDSTTEVHTETDKAKQAQMLSASSFAFNRMMGNIGAQLRAQY